MYHVTHLVVLVVYHVTHLMVVVVPRDLLHRVTHLVVVVVASSCYRCCCWVVVVEERTVKMAAVYPYDLREKMVKSE